MSNDRRFWMVVSVMLLLFVSNFYISVTSVQINQQRITNLEREKNLNEIYIRTTLEKVEASSRQTSEKVVEALTGLATVIAERSANDLRTLELLEAIHRSLNGENHGKE